MPDPLTPARIAELRDMHRPGLLCPFCPDDDEEICVILALLAHVERLEGRVKQLRTLAYTAADIVREFDVEAAEEIESGLVADRAAIASAGEGEG